jgi:8-oxo-dGTP pyrophosphatase MutT (NUDIX family)
VSTRTTEETTRSSLRTAPTLPVRAAAAKPRRDYDRRVRREFSAGGVVVRRLRGEWHAAAIRPGGKDDVWALPKGLVHAGEDPAATALREVTEETGVDGRLVGKLGDVRYVYTWKGERVFKVVSFYLVRYSAGRLGDVPEAFRHEIAETRWLPLADAPRLLSYRGERDMATRALELVERARTEAIHGRDAL